MFSAISNLIGSGTGVNSGQLLSDLLAASRAPKEAALNSKTQLNQSRISALASASSSLDVFAKALGELLDGQAFAGNLVSSDPAIASVGYVEGQRPRGLPATLEVLQVAAPQRLLSATVPDASVQLGAGSMTISTGAEDFSITLTPPADTLADLASAINRSGSGIDATILTDQNGARLVIEGGEGADGNFTLTGDFADYNYPSNGAGLTQISAATDALVRVDGVDLRYNNNSIEGAVPGIVLNLLSAEPGTTITINGDEPTGSVRSLVTEFVDAYNQLRSALNSATAPGLAGASGGPLAGDAGVRDMVRALGSISTTALSDSGPFRSLSDIGIRTNNDGTLAIDTVRLDAALANDIDAVSNMLDPQQVIEGAPGLAGILEGIRDRLQGENGALRTSQARLELVRENIADAREKLETESAIYAERLQRDFAVMDRQLSALRATQSYLTQQFAAWENDN